MTITRALQHTIQILQKVSEAPQLDAQQLLMHILKRKESSWLYTHGEEELVAKTQEKFEKLVQERATGKPLAYILGEWEFYGRPFYVTPDVLVPRPTTEELVEAALPHIRPNMSVADVGTGSGVIAITLALETSTHVIATDISKTALEIAKKNAVRHGVENRIEFLEGNMLEPLSKINIDLIVSNPPYIPTHELTQTPPPRWSLGLQFEPRAALDGGGKGQDFIRQIQKSGIPAVVEVTGGKIAMFNF